MDRLLNFEECIEQVKILNMKKNVLLGSGFSVGINKGLMYSYIQHQISFPYREHIDKKAPNIEKTMQQLSEHKNFTYGSLLTKDQLREEATAILLNNHFLRFKEISDAKVLLCHKFLRNFDLIFSTNFDLYLYAVQIHPILSTYYSDGFYTKRDGSRKRIWKETTKTSKNTSIYYIHGVFYIFYDEDTKKKKIIQCDLFPIEIYSHNKSYCIKATSRTNLSLVNVIKQKRSSGHDPILIFDGTYTHKCQQIISNPYLNRAFNKFGSRNPKKDSKNMALFIYGHSLDDIVDAHISHQIKTNQNIKEIYYGVYEDSINERQRIINLLEPERFDKRLYFFDSKKMDIWGTKALEDSFLKLPFPS